MFRHTLSITTAAFFLSLAVVSAQSSRPALQPISQHTDPTWESINRHAYPEWFADAKLGIFVHWGLYSVPAYAHTEGYAEWLYRGLMSHDPGRMRIMALYGDTALPTRELYASLPRYWHAELWNPDSWARTFEDAGARYVVLVTKHHDGYCLWNSKEQPEWNSVTSGPHRDIVTELTNAVRRRGLRMCFYYSLPEWSNPLHRWSVDPADSISRYVQQYMMPQFEELVSTYRPDMVFADGDWDFTSDQLRSKELISYYYNTVGAYAIVNDRWGSGTEHGYITPEYSAGIPPTERPWAECRGLGRSFGFNRNESLENIMTSRELVQHFAELVANGGGLILNVGPNADGTIPFIQLDRLHELGKWLHVNGEAIYSSRPMHDDDGNYLTTQTEPASLRLPVVHTIDYDWARNAPVAGCTTDNFAITWQGVPEPGTYRLLAEADDSASVVLNGKQLHNGDSLNVTASDTMTIRYFERTHEASVRLLKVQGRDTTPLLSPRGWQGVYSYDRTLRVFTAQPQSNCRYILEFARPGSQLIIDHYPTIDRKSVISLLGCQGALRWRQNKKTGRLTIDLSSIDPAELNALQYVWVLKVSPNN